MRARSADGNAPVLLPLMTLLELLAGHLVAAVAVAVVAFLADAVAFLAAAAARAAAASWYSPRIRRASDEKFLRELERKTEAAAGLLRPEATERSAASSGGDGGAGEGEGNGVTVRFAVAEANFIVSFFVVGAAGARATFETASVAAEASEGVESSNVSKREAAAAAATANRHR